MSASDSFAFLKDIRCCCCKYFNPPCIRHDSKRERKTGGEYSDHAEPQTIRLYEIKCHDRAYRK